MEGKQITQQDARAAEENAELARLREVNAELLDALRTLQSMGLGRHAYAICTEAIAKATNARA